MISIRDATAAVKAALQARGGKVVEAAELKRRADICVKCPMRKFVSMQPTDQISRVMGMMVNRHRVPNSLASYKCGVCGCSLMMLLPALPEDLHKDSPEQAELRQSRAPSCWVR